MQVKLQKEVISAQKQSDCKKRVALFKIKKVVKSKSPGSQEMAVMV